nr:substrate-binding domain-containing protein [Aeoliella straminimaris]
MVDNYAIGELAADHLFARGFREFGFFGLEEIQYSRTRWLGFSESLEKQGCSCSQLLATPTFRFDGATWMSQYEQLSKWLQSLQRPCGVFVVSDYRACQVLEACREQGISVPDQVAVVGVDDEQVICEHVSPTLTSVARNDALEGYKAAEMLDMLMKGEGLPSQEVIVPPSEVVTRDSTAAFAVSDERLHKALAHLHDHIHKPITIEELAAHADVSRRWLEYAFRDVFRETPYQYIRRQRLMKAKQLLADEPKASITSVAKRTGFASVKQMRIAFQQAYGMSPGEFRRSFES